MLFTFINLILISSTIFGFASIKNRIFQYNLKIRNEDHIFGVILISILALIGNFILPLKVFTPLIFIIGLTLFSINLIKKKYELDFLKFLIILFLFCFFTHNNPLNYDSPFYHLQIIKWSSEYKISFGLVNLEQRYAMPSIWHQFLSFFNYTVFNFNPVYLISLVLFSLIFNQALGEKNYEKLSSLYILFVSSFLFFFALIHPFQDGIIFNHLGSPETDIIGIIFFSYSFYFFLKILEDKKIEDFHYLLLFVFYGILTKISYAYLGFLLLSSLYIFKKKVFENKKIIILLSIATLFWISRNLIISGCFIFPISFTCLDFSWSNNINEIEYFLNEAKSWSRSTRLRTNAGNFDYTLNSMEWVVPWFKDYYLNTSILKILSVSLLVSFISLILGLILKKIKIRSVIKSNNLIIFIFVILGSYVWMQVPEVRYGHGLIILMIYLSIIVTVKSLKININPNKSFLKSSSFLLLFFLCIKNYDVLKTFNNIFTREFDYSNFIRISNINKYEIYSPNPEALNVSDYKKFCGNFKGICGYLNHPTKLETLKIEENEFGYLTFYN